MTVAEAEQILGPRTKLEDRLAEWSLDLHPGSRAMMVSALTADLRNDGKLYGFRIAGR
jgi:hypothetical protein